MNRRRFPARLDWLAASLIAAVIACDLPAASAEPPAVPLDHAAKSTVPRVVPMRVVRVRSSAPGCEPDCPEWISAEGLIDDGALPQFRKVLRDLGTRKLPILIDSGGGIVDEAVAIGRLIRSKGLDIAVTKTIFTPCAGDAKLPSAACVSAKPGVVPGRPKAYLARCASSCAFILAGGSRRFVGPTTFVGIHQLKTLQTQAQLLRRYRVETRLEWGVPVEVKRTLISEKRINEKTTVAKTPDSAYAKVARFFADMGVTDAVMPLLKSAPNTSIHWMTRTELADTHLATDLVDGEALILGPRTVQPLPATHASSTATSVTSDAVLDETHIGASTMAPDQSAARAIKP